MYINTIGLITTHFITTILRNNSCNFRKFPFTIDLTKAALITINLTTKDQFTSALFTIILITKGQITTFPTYLHMYEADTTDDKILHKLLMAVTYRYVSMYGTYVHGRIF
jgi:hypothetical protein